MNTTRGILKSKRVRIAVVAVAAAVVAYLLVGGVDGAVRLYRLRAEVRSMEEQLKQVNATVDSLHNEIRRLKSDTSYIESIARLRLGMAKKNEQIFKFVEDKKDVKSDK